MNKSEWDSVQIVPRYAPRPRPTPIPTQRWNDEPTLCIAVNVQWVGHILGLLEALDQPDTWEGTREQIADIRAQVNELMVAWEDCAEMACCPEVIGRKIDPTTGEVLCTTDGENYYPCPEDDPRKTGIQTAPPTGEPGSTLRCKVAENTTEDMRNAIDDWTEVLTAGGDIAALVAAIAGFIALFLGPAAALAPIFFTIAATLLTAGPAAIQAALTETVWNTFKCIVFCHVSDYGTFDGLDFEQIKADVNDQIGGLAATAITQTMDALGKVGFYNMGTTGTGNGSSCADCDSCNECPVDNSLWHAIGDAYIIERFTDGRVRIGFHAPVGGGLSYGGIESDRSTHCCYFTWTVVSGGGVAGAQDWLECGSFSNSTGLGHGHTAWKMYFRSDSGTILDIFSGG